jgi:hypothetical protein
MHTPTLRRQLADARSALREAQDEHDRIKAQAEQHTIESAGAALGTNDKARDRALKLALDDDPAYIAARQELRRQQAHVDHLQADVEDQIDDRRTADRASRDRLSTALEAVSVHADERRSAITILATPQPA